MDDRLKTSPPRRKQIGAKGFNFIYFFFFSIFFSKFFFQLFCVFFVMQKKSISYCSFHVIFVWLLSDFNVKFVFYSTKTKGKVISRFLFQLKVNFCIFHIVYVPGKYEMWEQRRFVLVRAKPSFLEMVGLRCSPEPEMNWTPCLTNFSLYIREDWKVKWPPQISFFFFGLHVGIF